MQHTSIKQRVLGAVVIIWVGYALLSSFAPLAAGANRYGLSDTSILLLKLSITIPLLVIWLLASYGAAAFKDYASSIAGSRDGAGMQLVANGLLLLVLSLILPSIVTVSDSYLGVGSLARLVSLLGSYLQVALSAYAYFVIWQGAQKLVGLAEASPKFRTSQLYLRLLAALGAGLYLWAYIVAGPRLLSAQPGLASLPFWVVVLTVALPTVVSWYFGVSAALSLAHYTQRIKGSIYRQVLYRLNRGILSVISITILIQFITVLGPAASQWSLQAVLIFVYSLLILLAGAFLLIAIGARDLRKIEEVV